VEVQVGVLLPAVSTTPIWGDVVGCVPSEKKKKVYLSRTRAMHISASSARETEIDRRLKQNSRELGNRGRGLCGTWNFQRIVHTSPLIEQAVKDRGGARGSSKGRRGW